MIVLYFFIIPMLYLPIKLILCFLTSKFGKLSYDGFSAAGFAYDSKNDIFYTTKNAWQRNFGYCHLYDVYAPIFRIIIDTEPIRFYYNNKNWLITFWKGQYGIATGAEVGVYYTNEKIVNKKTLYLPVKNKDLLDISFILYKNGEELSQVSDKHWWLSTFKLGMFSKPKDLTVDINMTFPNQNMLKAFLKGFEKLGYKRKNYEIIDNTFKFLYKKPRTHKVWTRNWLADLIRQHFNRKNTILYNNYLADLIDDNMEDDSLVNSDEKLIMINDIVPSILRNKPEQTKENIDNNQKEIEEDKKIEPQGLLKNDKIFLNDNIFSNIRNKL